MKVLIIGSGSIGQRHAASLLKLLPNVQIVFLREGERRKNESLPIEGCRLASSLEEEILQKYDLMVIANPSALHFPYIEAAIKANVPFYVEKPLVTSKIELERLRSIAANVVPINLVGCNMRFLPSLQLLKKMLGDGVGGNLVRVSFEAGQWLPDWRPQQDYTQSYSAKLGLGGGVLLDLIHEIDAARWLLGDFDSISGGYGQFSELCIETEDAAALLLSREHGPLTTIQLDYVSRTPVRKYTFIGDRGTIEWDLRRKRLCVIGSDDSIEVSPLNESDFSVKDTYLEAMRELLMAINERRPTSQPIGEGIAAMDIIFSVRKQ